MENKELQTETAEQAEIAFDEIHDSYLSESSQLMQGD